MGRSSHPLRQGKSSTAAGQNNARMAKRFPIRPAHPERTCWGCDKYCAAGDMACGNGSDRTQHPIELFGEGWERSGLDPLVSEEGPKESAPQGAKLIESP